MSMGKEDCLHDCTCCAKGSVTLEMAPAAVPDDWTPVGTVSLRCDLPVGHVGDHWDPDLGWFGG